MSERAHGIAFALVIVASSAVSIARAAEPAEPAEPKLQPVIGHDVRHDLSPPLWLMPQKDDTEGVAEEHEPLPLPKAKPSHAANAMRPAADPDSSPLASSGAALAPMAPPILSFDGVDARNGIAPPDTNGDVGPNHYVQWVNASYAVWNKQGTLLYGPVNGNTIWGGFGGLCEVRNNGDPIVLYDPIADRWFLSQLAFVDPADYHQCIAVSATPDPTGPWYRYDFLFSATLLNDYPKFGVWPDGYYLSVNQFAGVNPRTWAGQGVMAFERDKMLQGLPAQTIYFDLFGVNPNFGGALPSDLDGPVLPPVGAPNVFVEMDDDSFGWTSIDRLSLWNFHVDWATPSNATFGIAGQPDQVIDLTTAGFGFDSDLCGYSRNCIPQPGTPGKIDALSDRLMYRVVYRNWFDHESLTVNQTVDADGTDHAGVRWYELRRAGEVFAVHQAGTFAPDLLHRFVGSAAMDGQGDFAVGYSVSHESLYPEIRYAGRVPTDPPGALTPTEGVLVPGGGAQTAVRRWGDYSMLSVDPVDDCTFWYTQEYYAVTGGLSWATRVGSFRFPGCAACTLVGGATLSLSKESAGISVSVSGAQHATHYDVVVGDLDALRATLGDLAVATTACELNDVDGTTEVIPDAVSLPGAGSYYLARPIGLGCRGSYDDGSGSQSSARDSQIAGASGTCP